LVGAGLYKILFQEGEENGVRKRRSPEMAMHEVRHDITRKKRKHSGEKKKKKKKKTSDVVLHSSFVIFLGGVGLLRPIRKVN